MRASAVPTLRYWPASTEGSGVRANRRKMSGAATTAAAVTVARKMAATLTTALVASWSSSSSCAVNRGTRVAESTPPISSS